MSYSLTIELSPHADPAKTISVLCRNARGDDVLMASLHEISPKAIISVPPGCVIVIADNGGELPVTIFPTRPDWATRRS